MVMLRSLLAIALGSALVSRGAVAQAGSSSSLTHTVFVTVPPRVKVQVSAFSSPSASIVNAASVGASTQGLSLSVSATQPWVMSIGSNPSSERKSEVRWSRESGAGFSKLTSSQVTVASGSLATYPKASTVFFRNTLETASSDPVSQSGAAIVVTISAP